MKLPQQYKSRAWWISWALYMAFAYGSYFAARAWIRPRSNWAFWLGWINCVIVGSIMAGRTERVLKARWEK